MRRQQIVETVECDKCGTETTEPSSWIVEIGRADDHRHTIRRGIDLCPEHSTAVVELDELLRRVYNPPRDGGAVESCPLCDARLPAPRVSAHLVKKHKASAPQPPQCPDCDKLYSHPASLIAHRTYTHGYDHRSTLLASVASPKRQRRR